MPATLTLSLASSQRRGPWVAVLVASLVAGQARAQDPDHPGDRERDTEALGPLAPVSELPLELTPPPRLEVLYAQRLGQAGRHAEEAEQLEALERELGDPRLLYHAAMARSRAGQHALALQQLTRLIERWGPMSGPLRAFLDAKIAAEQAQLVSVPVEPREPAPQVVEVVTPRAARPRFDKDKKLIIGVAATMGVAFYAGVGVTVAGTKVESRAGEKDSAALTDAGVEEGGTPDAAQLAAVEAAYPTAQLHRDLRRGGTLQTVGAAVMMGGLGMVLGILPSLLRSKRRAAYIELGVGGAALVGGAVWMHDYLRRLDAKLGPTDPEQRAHESGLVGHRLGASMLTGLGIGMTLGSGLLLLTDHLKRRKPLGARVAPYGGQGQAGLVVRGEF